MGARSQRLQRRWCPGTRCRTGSSEVKLRNACQQLCAEFQELFKPEVGCLKDCELEIKFNQDAKSVFCKPRMVPFVILEDLNQAYDAGIKKGYGLRRNSMHTRLP